LKLLFLFAVAITIPAYTTGSRCQNNFASVPRPSPILAALISAGSCTPALQACAPRLKPENGIWLSEHSKYEGFLIRDFSCE